MLEQYNRCARISWPTFSHRQPEKMQIRLLYAPTVRSRRLDTEEPHPEMLAADNKARNTRVQKEMDHTLRTGSTLHESASAFGLKHTNFEEEEEILFCQTNNKDDMKYKYNSK